jgi:hypothetical protein
MIVSKQLVMMLQYREIWRGGGGEGGGKIFESNFEDNIFGESLCNAGAQFHISRKGCYRFTKSF